MSNLSNDIILDLKLTNRNLVEGQSDNTLPCPVCGHKDFSISRKDGNLLFICFRAKCGIKGIIHEDYAVETSCTNPIQKKKRSIKRYTGEWSLLTKEQWAYLYKKYEINDGDGSIYYNSEQDRLVFQVTNYFDAVVGYMTKIAPWSKADPVLEPKTILYNQDEYFNGLHFEMHSGYDEDLIIVEDILSAIKLTKYTTTCALLGTHLSDDQIYYIKKHYDSVIMCLDPDANNKSLGYKQKYGSLFSSFKCIFLEKDPKDTPYNILDKVFL